MNDGSAPWIKIITRIFEDPKIVMIETSYPESYGILLLWFKLLTLAGEQNRCGTVYFTDAVPFTADLLAAKWRCKSTLVQLALGVFQKLGMIGIDQEGTIHILNWAKYQNEEGMARIRDRSLIQLQDSADKAARQRELGPAELEQRAKKTRDQTRARTKRWRERVRDGASQASQPVTRDGPGPGAVTPQNQKQNQKQTENIPPAAPPGGTEMSAIDVQTTKQWLNDLFGRKRDWSGDEDALLVRLLPISREDRELIQWGYSLPRDSEGWALLDGDRVTKPKQSLISLLREFASELDKFRRHYCREDVDLTDAAGDGWTDRRRQSALEMFGDADLPKTFAELGASMCRRIDEYDWPLGGKNAAQQLYGSDVTLPDRFSQMAPSAQQEIRKFLASKSPTETTLIGTKL